MKKPSKYTIEVIKSALILARNESITHLNDAAETNKHIFQADVDKYNDALFELFGE